MDYEKAYRGAIERAKAEQETFIKGGNISAKTAIERIFPELRESEDERIKNEIIAFVEQSIHRGGGTPIPQEQENKWIVWLEKQGEQKPANKVEPKFKIGDWVVDKHHLKIYQVYSIDNLEYNYIVYSCKPLFNTNDDWPCFHEDMIRLWTIQDAKDGDVLAYHNGITEIIMMFKSWFVEKRTAYTHFHVFDNIYRVNDSCICGNDAHPATKEQRELLFTKMKEAGYEWDAEKKELKKIEQTSDWSEEDEKYIAHIIAALEGWDREHSSLIPSVIPKCIDWLKSLKPNIH